VDAADFNTSLEKGDFVQTAVRGGAHHFCRWHQLYVKTDALIVVEESREDPVTRATKVAVQVTSGRWTWRRAALKHRARPRKSPLLTRWRP